MVLSYTAMVSIAEREVHTSQVWARGIPKKRHLHAQVPGIFKGIKPYRFTVLLGTTPMSKDFFDIEGVLVDSDLLGVKFACDLTRCKGACCTMPSELGAPLSKPEIRVLAKVLPIVKGYLPRDHVLAIEEKGFWESKGGAYRIRCRNKRDCVFVYYEGDIARCGIERAYREGRIDFVKPLSCHLFPIRISAREGPVLRFEYYHECKPAMIKGRKEDTLLIDFCRDALRRAFGDQWLKEMARIVPG